MTTLTKKEIKELKKEICEKSAIYLGYNSGIIKEFTAWEISEIIKELSEATDLSKWKTYDIENILITKLIEKSTYQKFKTHLIQYFLCYNRDRQ